MSREVLSPLRENHGSFQQHISFGLSLRLSVFVDLERIFPSTIRVSLDYFGGAFLIGSQAGFVLPQTDTGGTPVLVVPDKNLDEFFHRIYALLSPP